jgi:DNA-binding NarL/FixJ family response regulator
VRSDQAVNGGPALTVRVVLVDDQNLVRAGFNQLLSRDPEIEVVGEAADGLEGIDVVRDVEPDVVLMDIRMPLLDGLEATRRLLADPRTSGTSVVVLTTFESDENVFTALQAGATGFLIKDIDPDELRRAVKVAAAGEALLSPSVTRRLIEEFTERLATPPLDDSRLEALTDREREVMAVVAEGLSNQEISDRLYMSPATVKTHISRILTKLDARDRTQLVVIAYETGLTRPGESTDG